jgi:hypothetical protein
VPRKVERGLYLVGRKSSQFAQQNMDFLNGLAIG